MAENLANHFVASGGGGRHAVDIEVEWDFVLVVQCCLQFIAP